MATRKKQATTADKKFVEMIQKNYISFIKYRQTNPDEVIDLSGAKFTDLILSGIDLRKCILKGAEFIRCIMCGMTMDYNAKEVKFIECNLAGADMTGSLLREAIFKKCNLAGANMSGADLRLSNFDECNTTLINFTAANIAYTKGLTAQNIDAWYEQTLSTIVSKEDHSQDDE